MSSYSSDIVVRSWSELCEKVYDNSWRADLMRFRTDYAFRGVSDKDYPLLNRFQRHAENHAQLEFHLLRNFKKYAKIYGESALQSDWRVLTIGQHYGLPTRLLDWTYSPFVAIHFATENIEHYDRDGVIWKIDFKKANSLLPEPLAQVLHLAGSNSFTIEMLEQALPSIHHFDAFGSEPHVLFFEPPSIDERIINQFAFFSVMSSPNASLQHWLNRHPEIWRRIIIPKELKWEVRDKLDQSNITERLLFPGLDGLAKWLARHYYPRTT
jgi:hypothetical protein